MSEGDGPNCPDWLTAAPIAHRGLHDRAGGAIENSLTAARRAISAGYAIECDVQPTADGEAVVFHDETLDRLTGRAGHIQDLSAAEVGALRLAGTQEAPPLFAEFLDLVAGRVPVICEVKSRFDGDVRLARRAAAVAAAYPGPLAFKSFDPDMIACLRADACPRPLGIVSEALFDDPDYDAISPERRRELVHFLHFPATRPDFLSFHVGDLPHAVPFLLRTALHRPVMAWTVRTPEQRDVAGRWADQIVFEGFRA